MGNALPITDTAKHLFDRAGLLIEEAIMLLDEAGASSAIAAHLDHALHRLRATADKDR